MLLPFFIMNTSKSTVCYYKFIILIQAANFLKLNTNLRLKMTEISFNKPSQKDLLLQDRLSVQRLSFSKNTKFKLGKGLTNLAKILTFKNNKITTQRKQQQRYMNSQDVYSVKNYDLIENDFDSDMTQIPLRFQERDTPVQIQQLKPRDINTYQILKNLEKMKLIAKKSRMFWNNRISQDIGQGIRRFMSRQWELGQKDKVVEFMFQSFNIQNQLSQRQQEKQMKSLLLQRIDGNARNDSSDRIDFKINIYLEQKGNLGHLIQSMQQYLETSGKFSNIKLFIILMKTITGKLGISESQNVSIVQSQKRLIQEEYCLNYSNNERKLDSYVNVRCRKTVQSQKKQSHQFYDDQNLVFWCKRLMMFFSGQQLTRNRQLNQKGSNSESKFDPEGPIPTIEQIKKVPKQRHNIFYIILLKVLTEQKLEIGQVQALYESQRQLVVFYKLQEFDYYYKTKEFHQKKLGLINGLKLSIQTGDLSKVQKTTQELVGFLTFDQLFFDVLCSQKDSISAIQKILLIKTLLSHSSLLIHSLINKQQWAKQSIKYILKTIQNNNRQNADKLVVLIIEVLSFCKQHLSNQVFRNCVLQTLTRHKSVVQSFLSQNFNYAKIITCRFCLQVTLLQKLTQLSIYKYGNYLFIIKVFLSKFIRMEEVAFHQKNLSRATAKSIVQTNIFVNQSRKNIGKLVDLREKETLKQAKQNYSIFLLGLKLMTKFLLKMSVQKVQNNSNSDISSHLSWYLIIYKMTKNVSQQMANCLNQMQKQMNSKPTNQSHDKNQQTKRFLGKINQFIQISQFVINFINLRKYFYNQEPKVIGKVSSWIQKMSKSDLGLSLQIDKVCTNLRLLQLEDQTYGYKIISKEASHLLQLFKSLDRTRSRKVNFINNQVNFPIIVQFLSLYVKMMSKYPGIQSESSLYEKAQKVDKLRINK